MKNTTNRFFLNQFRIILLRLNKQRSDRVYLMESVQENGEFVMNLFSRVVRIVESWLNTQESDFHRSQRYYRESDAYSDYTDQAEHSVDPKIAEYYANLEIPVGSDLETVQSAWKKMMRKYHPDLHARDAEKRQTAELLTQRLNTAYEELTKYLKGTKI